MPAPATTRFPILVLVATFLVVLGGTFTGFADEGDSAWTHFPFGNDFSAVEADGDTIWVATQSGGVLELDTVTGTWRKYSQGQHCLPSNIVEDIAIDGDGAVWIATGLGLGRRPAGAGFDTPWDEFNSSNSPLPDGNITAVESGPDGTIWVGTFDSGLFHHHADGTWSTFDVSNSPLSDNFVTSIKFDLIGAMWIGVWSAGVDRFDGARWFNFSPQNTFPGGTGAPNCLDFDLNSFPPDQLGLISIFVEVIGVDPVTGDMWFSNDDDGPCLLNGTTRYDGGNWFTYTNENSNALQDQHQALVRDANGDLLFSSIGTFERFDGSDWVPADAHGNFVPGRDMALIGSDLWIAAGSGELVRIRNGALTGFVPPGPVDSAVWDVATITTQLPNEPPMDRDAIAWIATRSGLQRYDGIDWVTYDTTNSGLPHDRTFAIAQDLDGSLWLGANFTGLTHFDGQSWQSWGFDDGLFVERVRDIEVHPLTGEKWVLSDFGVVARTLDGSSFINHTVVSGGRSGARGAQQLPGAASDIAIAPDGSVWITTNSGLVHVVDDTWTVMTEDDGLPINHMFAVDVDQDGNVWTGSSIGVSMFDGSTWTTMLPLPSVPDSNHVTEIAVAANGDVWAALLSLGVAQFDGSNWTHYTVLDDNLVSDQVQAFDVRDNGEIWMGTFNGVMVFNGPAEPAACATDLTGVGGGPDGVTDVFDLFELLGNWGADGPGAALAPPVDVVDVFDLFELLSGWGVCE